MPDTDYDLFVLGAGSGGVRCSRMSAGYGAKVAVAESGALGGTCVNVGCIPKKLLVYASHLPHEVEDMERGYGWKVGPREFDWKTLIENKNREIERLNGIYQGLLDGAGVEVLHGRAKLVDRHTVAVGDQHYTARHILVAVGGWPYKLDIPGAEHAITSNEAFYLDELPRRVLVVGGGYIAVEFAGIFHGMGAEVVQAYRGPLFLRGFDDDVREALAHELPRQGIDLRMNCAPTAIERTTEGLRVSMNDGTTLVVDQVLMATGRVPNTSGLGLEEAGVELGPKGEIVVDEFSRSSVDNIWAIGDVTDRINLTPVAIHEGMCLASTLFDDDPRKPDHEYVASAVFSQPPVGSVGWTEAEARERFDEVDVYRATFRALKDTLTGGEGKTMMKLLVDRKSDRVVGLHMVGPDAGEIVQGFAVAIKCGATKKQFDATMPIHPTSAEEFVTMREPVG